MSLFAGTTAPKDIRIGNTQVKALYVGSTLIWTRVPLTATVSPSSVTGLIVTELVTVTAAGGAGTYSYQWHCIGSPGVISATAPTSATTAFQTGSNAYSQTAWRCVVSDGHNTVHSPSVIVNFLPF